MIGLVGVPEVIAARIEGVGWFAVPAEVRYRMHDRVASIVMPRDMLFELTEIRREVALLLRRQLQRHHILPCLINYLIAAVNQWDHR